MAFPFPGKSAALSIGGTAKPLDKFDIAVDGKPIEYTNFTSAGWQEIVGGIKSAKITASGPYNGIASGASAGDLTGTAVDFIPNFGSSGPTFTIHALISKFTASTDVNGVGQCSIEADSTGAQTMTY